MSKALVVSNAICASLSTLNVHVQTQKVQVTVVDSDQKELMGECNCDRSRSDF